MTNSQNAISIRDIKKTYQAKKNSPAKNALKGFDLDIPKGSMFALLGPNGAGKSTLINIMAGLVNKTSGTIEIWGYNIDTHMRQAKSTIGIVPQELNIDPFFTPQKLLDLHAGLYGIPKNQRKTEEILKSVGLWEKRDAYARQLSGGMRRRLLIAKAMVHSPPILILDEPTAGVDIELRQQLWQNIKTLNAQGVTIILTTHYLEEAEELCDYIAVINKGQLIVKSTKQEMLQSVDTKTINITFDKPFDTTYTFKNTEITIKNPKTVVQFKFSPKIVNVADILNDLQKHTFVIHDISTVEADLEDVFLHLTS